MAFPEMALIDPPEWISYLPVRMRPLALDWEKCRRFMEIRRLDNYYRDGKHFMRNDDKLSHLLTELLKLEKLFAFDNGKLDSIDECYRKSISISKKPMVLILYNQFRLRNIERLSLIRPRVLIGGMNSSIFPNFHSIDLLKVADVVSMSTTPNENRVDRVYWNVFSDRLEDVLKRLPKGFVPDIFFDNQIDGKHFVPIGIEDAPFPTVVGLCHMQKYNIIKRACKLFDVVIPLSKNFIPLVSALDDVQVLDLPFGLNWGSFHETIACYGKKDIDISVTFQRGDEYRNKVWDMVEKFVKENDAKYSFYLAKDRIEKNEYIDILKRSKIAINVVGNHGPYNYRTCEIINSGALLFQYTNTKHYIETDLNEYLSDWIHYVSFDENNFSSNLNRLLDNDALRNRIAEEGKRYIEDRYSYEVLYNDLFNKLGEIKVDFSKRITPARAKLNTGMMYWHYGDTNISAGSFLAFQAIIEDASERKYENLLGLMPAFISLLNDYQIENLLRSNTKLYSELKKGDINLFDYLLSRCNESLLGKWNYFIACHELLTDNTMIASSILESINNADDISYLDGDDVVFNCYVNSKDINFNIDSNKRLHYFEMDLLKHSSNRITVSNLYKEFINWHCEYCLSHGI